uniref:Uncharacterized protein n=1 Tax=Poecilia mexicana TaxID=48701 RepID=A0A3B3WKS6_9TELE
MWFKNLKQETTLTDSLGIHPVKKKCGSSFGIISRSLKMPNSAVQAIIRKYRHDGNTDSRTEAQGLVKMLLKLVRRKKPLLQLAVCKCPQGQRPSFWRHFLAKILW